MNFNVIIYIILGILPSLIWLSYYLTKDLHPEPKRMIIKIFLWGALITIPIFFVEIGLTTLINGLEINTFTKNILYWFLAIAFVEEFFKYLVVKMKVINSPHLDEPLDIMLYMVVAALGFTAVENVLYLFAPIGAVSFTQLIQQTFLTDLVRFIGATFLHTLCSAVIGYTLAISFCEVKNKKLILVFGIIIATLLHGLFNFSIMTLDDPAIRYTIPVIIILTLAFLVFSGFEKLKKMKSICKIK